MTFESKIDAFLDVHNRQDQPGVVLAIIKNGAIPVLQNSSLGPKEAEYVCIHSDVVAAITESNVLSSLKPFKRQFLKGLIIVGSHQNGNIKFDNVYSNPDPPPSTGKGGTVS